MRPRKHIDAGAVFGSWLVLGPYRLGSNRKYEVLCRCACNAEHWLVTNALLSGHSTRCRTCSNVSRAVAIDAGATFGIWTVIGPSRPARPGHGAGREFLCTCACGVQQWVSGIGLRRGGTTQCKRCALFVTAGRGRARRSALALADARGMIGERFTRWIVLDAVSGRTLRVLCDCGVTATVSKRDLRGRHSRSCGCLAKELAQNEATIYEQYGKTTALERVAIAINLMEAKLCK